MNIFLNSFYSINHPKAKHGEKIWYYNIGLSGEDKDEFKKRGGVWKMKTLPSIIKMLKHQGVS